MGFPPTLARSGGPLHSVHLPAGEVWEIVVMVSALAMNLCLPCLLVSESKSLDDCEELVINTTATINNLSFYQVKNSAIQNQKLYIAECEASPWLWIKAHLLKNCFLYCADSELEAFRFFVYVFLTF